MAGIMPLGEVKERVKELTEASPVCIIPKDKGVGCYPYVKLPLESRNEYVPVCGHALVYMWHEFIECEGIEVTSLLHPEAKAFPLIPYVLEHSGVGGPIPRKRKYATPNEVCIRGEGTAYRKGANMYFDLEEQDTDLLVLEGIASSGDTITGFIKSLDGAKIAGKKRNLVGALSVWERGDGLYELKKEYPGKIFAGFARLEIIPREGKREELMNKLGTENIEAVPSAFLKHLQGSMSDKEFLERREEYFHDVNEYLRPSVPRFFDGDRL
jgi:hypothetical protein